MLAARCTCTFVLVHVHAQYVQTSYSCNIPDELVALCIHTLVLVHVQYVDDVRSVIDVFPRHVRHDDELEFVVIAHQLVDLVDVETRQRLVVDRLDFVTDRQQTAEEVLRRAVTEARHEDTCAGTQNRRTIVDDAVTRV